MSRYLISLFCTSAMSSIEFANSFTCEAGLLLYCKCDLQIFGSDGLPPCLAGRGKETFQFEFKNLSWAGASHVPSKVSWVSPLYVLLGKPSDIWPITNDGFFLDNYLTNSWHDNTSTSSNSKENKVKYTLKSSYHRMSKINDSSAWNFCTLLTTLILILRKKLLPLCLNRRQYLLKNATLYQLSYHQINSTNYAICSPRLSKKDIEINNYKRGLLQNWIFKISMQS